MLNIHFEGRRWNENVEDVFSLNWEVDMDLMFKDAPYMYHCVYFAYHFKVRCTTIEGQDNKNVK